MTEVQNSNPTILNAADLPTRLRPTNSSKSNNGGGSGGGIYATSIFASALPAGTNQHDPFASGPEASDPSDNEEDELIEEPIDEQEIFGMQLSPPLSPLNVSRIINQNDQHQTISMQMQKPGAKPVSDLISTISDPEHPISLGSLAVVSLPDIDIKPSLPNVPDSPLRTVTVLITPTITHCSLATVIGLGVRVRLEQSLPPRFRIDVRIKEGTHSTADEVNKQLADKERVAAALENGTLMGVIAKMMETCQ